jgi:antirestriction protein ArdC
MRNFVKRQGHAHSSPRDHYAEITAQVVAALEAGTPPWRQPWDSNKAGGPMTPHNAVTGARYRGINTLLLGMSPLAFMSGDPRWATYKQAADRGWQVRKGSQGTPGFFYKPLEIKACESGLEDERKIVHMLRSFTLFNGSQIDGIPPYVAPGVEEAPWREVDAIAIIARNSKAVIRIGGDRAFYSPGLDFVQMPPTSCFRTPAAHANVLSHELSHWAAGPNRLNRNLSGRFGSHSYCMEELVAELSQLLVCTELDVKDCDFTNGAAYISEWASRLKEDKKAIFRAASEAQRTADYLLGFHPAYAERISQEQAKVNRQVELEPAANTDKAELAEVA